MKHFRVKASKKYLCDDYKYYPQYRKNILCPYRYLKINDVRGLNLEVLNKQFLYSGNVDSNDRVFLESLRDARTICELYNRFLDCQTPLNIYTYLDI
mgnify:CR=1 FL=1